MTDTLHVGNIGDRMSDQQLRELFAEAGAVQSARVPADAKTGQPRGFGLVEMATYEDSQSALRTLHGRSVGGRVLSVRLLPARAPGWEGGNDQGGSNRSHGIGVGNGGSLR